MKHALNTVNTLVVDVNATKITMVIVVNIGMNAHLIKTVAYKENVLTLMERRYRRNNVTAIWDGSVLVVIKVNILHDSLAYNLFSISNLSHRKIYYFPR